MTRNHIVRLISLTGTVFVFTVVLIYVLALVSEVNVASANPNTILPVSSTSVTRSNHDRFAFSPDGNSLASATDDGQIVLLNLLSGKQRLIGPGPLGSVVADLAFSPDGKTLACVLEDTITLWDMPSGQVRGILSGASNGIVTHLLFSPDGESLAGVADGKQILIWDVKSRSQRWTLSSGDAVSRIAFARDATILASSGEDERIRLWDPTSGQELVTLTSRTAVTGFAFSPVSMTLASVDQEANVSVWDLESGDDKQILTGQRAPINGLAFSPDGTILATGGIDARVKLLDVTSGEERLSLLSRGDAALHGFAFSPDGRTLAGVSDNSEILLWEVASGKLRQRFVGHKDIVAEIAFNPNRQVLASVSNDGQVIVWDLAGGVERIAHQISGFGSDPLAFQTTDFSSKTLNTVNSSSAAEVAPVIDPGLQNQSSASQTRAVADLALRGTRKRARARNWKGITALAVSPDGALVGSAGEDSAVRLWDATGSERFALAAHHGAGVTGIAFGAGGTRLVSAGRDTEVQLWDVTTGTQSKVLQGSEHPIRTIAASPDGKILAAAGEDTRILLWDAATEKLTGILLGHTNFVNSLAFSGDGKQLASGDADARVLLWDMVTGKLVKTLLGHSEEVNALAFSRNGSVLVSAGEDTQVKVWNAATGQQIRSLLGHQAPVRAVAISPNGQTVVSAGEDMRILVWDVASGQLRRDLPRHNRFINALAFDPTGRLFVGDEDEDLTEWDVSAGKKLRVRRALKRLQQNRSSSAAPSAASQTLGLFIPSDSSRGTYSDTRRNATLSLQGVFGAVLEWLVPGAAAQLPDPNQGPGGPILVVTGASSTFGKYYAEILRSEGLNLFSVSDISSVNAATLASYDAVILAPLPLSVAQVGMFTDWVNAGGNLIAMRPDPQLSGLLGISPAGATLSNAYLLVDTSQSPGSGIVGQTIQFHGTADRYTLNSASSLATLYVNATTTTSNPAVTMRSIGANGGQAAAFTYDLATSIVYTRQGNPAWAAQERDGSDPIRSDDKFFGDANGDPQPDWVDLNKVAIPQADEQQRLLANLILHMNLDRKPLPRFWYFPRGEKAVVIMTGDDHGNGGTEGRFNQFISLSPPGCSVANWECVRGTSYVYPNTPTLTNAEAAGFNAAGFEVGLHINANCPTNYTPASLENDYTQQISDWTSNYPSIPPPITQRHHCIMWSDWVTGAIVQFNHGIRLDTNYYFWPPGWVLNRPGLFTGSAMPMRFAQLNGTLVDVYNATTQMTDESDQQYPFTIDTLLDRALGPEGYYGAYTVNAHTDLNTSPVADAVVASALTRGVPIVSSRQMLAWLDGRNNSSFGTFAWSGNTLSFSVAQDSAANGLQALVPRVLTAGVLTGITRNGSSITFTTEVIKGVSYAVVSALSGAYAASFAQDTTPPTVVSHSPSAGASGVSQADSVTATFSEDMNSGTVGTGTFELRGPGSTLVAATVTYNGASRIATLDPSSNLLASTIYTATVKGEAAGVKDAGGNAMVSDFTWSFTTEAAPCSTSPCSGFSSSTPANPSASDPNAVELGVKFRSDLGGFITGIRFYKGSGNTGTHIGKLWTASGTQLATATFSSETASGWQQVSFGAPVAITPNTVYVASYHAPNGGYAFDSNYFASSGFQNGPLYFLRDGESGGNGVYVYGAGGFPTNTFNATNYWVDVVFTTSGGTPPDTTPPTDPTNLSATAVGTSQIDLTWTGSTDNVGVSGYRVERCQGAGCTNFVEVATPAGTSHPDSGLTPGTTYRYRVRAADAVPNFSGYSNIATATTATAATCTGNTIWPATAVPAVAADPDTSAVELGVKFRSDVNGTACGVRFYKGSTNTGTHVGKLWSSGGTLLAQATFTNETASGWQQVNFSSPVAITANTVYVVSYHAPNGHYALNEGGFTTTGVDTPPLHALQNGVSGGNGVYLYGAGGFPTNTFASSNYWVDVVFIPGTAPTLASIAVTPANPTIQTSATQQFTATGTYSDSSTQNITTQVTWASSNTAVATINSAGLATAGTGAGTTTISATSGAVSGNTTLTVQTAPPINTGFRSPSANAAVTSSAGDNNGFAAPANAYVEDSQFAIDTDSGTGTGTSCTGAGKDKHNYYNYDFIVPSGVAIRGIEVRLAARVDSAAGAPRMCAQLSWNGGTTWTTALSTTTLTTTTLAYFLGSATNTWGRTWTVGDFSNANFRVRIINVASSIDRDFSLDRVAVRVTYQ